MIDEGAVAPVTEALPDALKALCEITGMKFSILARVTETRWTICAIHETVPSGYTAGLSLDASSTMCTEMRRNRNSIVIDQASIDPLYKTDPRPKRYGFESYISVPIVLADGDYFGNLCAWDPRPAFVSEPKIQLMFHCFASLIAQHIDVAVRQRGDRATRLDPGIVASLRGLFIAMLAQGPLGNEKRPTCDPALRQLANRAMTPGHRMSSLVNEVLVYARGRLNGGMPGYIWKVDDLNSRLKAVVADMLAAHPRRTIITNITVDCPVDCDPARIQQLAVNLLKNALAHGAPSGPVSFIASTSGNDLEISVWNEGNVLSKQAIRTVFRPAWRPAADRPAARLGLHLCAQIVRAHLGTIAVTSCHTDGTRFIARIPVARSLRLH